MGEQTKIEWCDHTFNPWRGCSKVHTGCANCYAEKGAKRNPSVLGLWGANGTRVVAAEKTWGEPAKWDRCAVLRCNECGNEYKTEPAPKGCEPVSHSWDFECVCGCNRHTAHRPRVFCASLADVFEDWKGPVRDHLGNVLSDDGDPAGNADMHNGDLMTMDDLRRRLFALIDATPNLEWLLVTKRPENVRRMWPGLIDPAPSNSPEWPGKLKHRPNVWLLTSVSDQQTYDSAAPHLWRCRDLVPVLGFSAEPLLGPIKIHHEHDGQLVRNWAGCWDWIIVGGESGHDARPCDLSWVRSIVGQCRDAGVSCFVKQLGALPVGGRMTPQEWRLRDPKGGDWNEWPSDLRVREWPTTWVAN